MLRAEFSKSGAYFSNVSSDLYQSLHVNFELVDFSFKLFVFVASGFTITCLCTLIKCSAESSGLYVTDMQTFN